MELNIKDFDDLESYFKKKAQHVEELEQENTELTIENRKLHQEIDRLHQGKDRLRRSQAEYINQILNRKKPSAETDDQADITTASIPYLLRKREQ